MRLYSFLSQDLSVIKKKLNVYIQKKNKYGDNILHNLIHYNISLPKIKYIFEFCNLHCKSLLLEKNDDGQTFLEFLNNYKINHLNVVKYILEFYSLNFPFIFLEKDNYRSTFEYLLYSPSLSEVKFILKFYILNFPFVFLEKNEHGVNVFYKLSFRDSCYLKYWDPCVVKHSSKFCVLNFPEISKRTNNFILPLLMEIQN